MNEQKNYPFHHCPYCKEKFEPAIRRFLKENLIAISCNSCGTVISCTHDMDAYIKIEGEEEANSEIIRHIIKESH